MIICSETWFKARQTVFISSRNCSSIEVEALIVECNFSYATKNAYQENGEKKQSKMFSCVLLWRVLLIKFWRQALMFLNKFHSRRRLLAKHNLMRMFCNTRKIFLSFSWCVVYHVLLRREQHVRFSEHYGLSKSEQMVTTWVQCMFCKE